MKKILLITFTILNIMNAMSQDFTKLENFLDKKITGKLTPGVQFIIADSSGILYEYNNGLTNIDKSEKVNSNTQFKMYSSTKLLTMLAIMQLVEQGKINLDAPVSDYLEFDFPKKVTIRKTLSHTAGFSRYPFVKEINLEKEKNTFNYSDFIAEMIPKHKKLIYKTDSKNIYSNFGYLVLSAIIEEVSGEKYEDYIQANIIKKAELEDSDYIGFEYTDLTATAYQKRATLMHLLYSKMVDTEKYYGTKTKDWQSYKNLYMQGVGFGGGFANAKGLAQLFLKVLDHKIISEGTLNKTFEKQSYKKNKPSKQALGWWNGNVNGNTCYHHAGGGGGYSCEIRVYPGKKIVRIIMMNKTQSISDLKLFSRIDKLWMD